MLKETASQANKVSGITAHGVLRKITLKHLKDAYGEVEMLKKGMIEIWRFNEITVKPNFYADHDSTAFIMTSSKVNVESVIREKACFMGSDWFGGKKDRIVIYFFQPEIVRHHYIFAGVKKKGSTNTWHVRINHDDVNLIFKRAGNAEDVLIPIDEHNYYIQYKLTDDEAEELQNAVHKRKSAYAPQNQLLKIVVKSIKGEKEFSKKSPLAIVIFSILKESPELTVEEILPFLSSYDVDVDKASPVGSLRYILRELMNIGAVVCNSEKQYRINKDVQVEVIL